jgi:alpha-galactosidase
MKTKNDEQADNWADVILTDGPEKIVTYRTAWTTYEESLTGGRYVGRGWNGSGFVNYYDGRIDPKRLPKAQAFWVEVDGQLLASDWEWAGFEKRENNQPIAAMPNPFRLHTTVTLKHRLRPVTVEVHTGLDGSPVLTRWLTVQNTGERPAAIGSAFTWSGPLLKTPRWQMHLPDKRRALYSVGYMVNPLWGNEGDFQWVDLPNAGYQIDGRYGRDRHRHPMFVLRNNATGEHFIGQLAWSGGYSFFFDLDADAGKTDQAAFLSFRAGMDAPAPVRVLEPGEAVALPEMHLGMVCGDLDAAIQGMHDHIRRSVIMRQPRGHGGWVESGIGPELEITPEQVNHAIDAAGDLGAEVFFIDASWYAPPKSHWAKTVGDWNVDLTRFPGGLKPIRDRVHARGMLWGLWMDAERIAVESRIVKEHPEWLAEAYDGEKRLSDLLDLTNPEAANWMEGQIVRVIEENELEFFRLDHNVGGMAMGPRAYRHGFAESSHWRYYEALYGIYDRLRARFPDVIFENCAGGGGRTDLGLVRRFSHTWVTDWQIAPRSFAITNGMTMALPPEYVDRLLGGQSGHTAGSFDFQTRLLLFVRPTMGYFFPLGADWNPWMRERASHGLKLYKEFVRPFQANSRIYHHTPVVTNPEPQGWGVLELASVDRSRAIAGLFQLSAPTAPEYLLRFRGLDVSKRYRVTFDNAGETCELSGAALVKDGITVRLESALASELIVCQAV